MNPAGPQDVMCNKYTEIRRPLKSLCDHFFESQTLWKLCKIMAFDLTRIRCKWPFQSNNYHDASSIYSFTNVRKQTKQGKPNAEIIRSKPFCCWATAIDTVSSVSWVRAPAMEKIAAKIMKRMIMGSCVAQLAERSFPIPEGQSLNPIIYTFWPSIVMLWWNKALYYSVVTLNWINALAPVANLIKPLWS